MSAEVEKAVETVRKKLFDTRSLPPLKDNALEALDLIVAALKARGC